MDNMKEYIKSRELNLKDLIYHNMIWNKSCYDSKKIKSNINWWEVAQNGWGNTVLFMTKYLNMNMIDILGGTYYNLASYNVMTYPSDNYKATEYKVYATNIDEIIV